MCGIPFSDVIGECEKEAMGYISARFLPLGGLALPLSYSMPEPYELMDP